MKPLINSDKKILSHHDKNFFSENGYVVLPNFVSENDCDVLRSRALQLAENIRPSDVRSVFSSYIQNNSEPAAEYIRESADKIRFFFEETAFDGDGNLNYPAHLALCKMGHGLHDSDPIFDRFSRSANLALLTKELGFERPLLAQSMYLFKQAGLGAEIACHQDASFIYTSPSSVMGFWFALEDATLENGCLRVLPQGHKLGLKSRFIRTNQGERWIECNNVHYSGEKFIPLEVKQGTLIVLDGMLPHLSNANTSSKSRHAYTLHIIEGTANYASDNWLLRSASNPFRGF